MTKPKLELSEELIKISGTIQLFNMIWFPIQDNIIKHK